MWLHVYSYLYRRCLKIVKHPTFDAIILLFILFSSVNLILDEPRANPDSNIQRFIYYIDYGLAVVFAIEMGLKLIAFGVFLHAVSTSGRGSVHQNLFRVNPQER